MVQKLLRLSATESTLKNNKILHNKLLAIRHHRNNLTEEEAKALEKLSNDNDIIIKPEDKGGAKLSEPLYKGNIPQINDVLESMKSDAFISTKQLHFLLAKNTDRARTFYMLPKIHKPREKWPQPDMPEGRPIVSDYGSESYNVSKYIDSWIRPISIRHPSYLKDTYDFVSKIRGQKIPKNALLVTGDVSALYTNMHIDRTLQVTKSALAKYRDPQRPDKYILRLLEITLRNNFTFNGEYFQQICGTAMGKSYAPGLADLYLKEFDEKATNGYKIKPLFYYRFLDDIHFIWIGTTEELQEFETYLNSLISGIKITLNYSYESVDFLDTTIYKTPDPSSDDHDTLCTRVFFKQTDTHQLLHKNSFHPRHTFTGVLKAQLLRFKRISTSFSDYNNA